MLQNDGLPTTLTSTFLSKSTDQPTADQHTVMHSSVRGDVWVHGGTIWKLRLQQGIDVFH